MDLQDMATSVMLEEGRTSAPFGLYVIPSLDPRSQLGRHVEHAVFGEFFGETEEFLRQEYDRYEHSSTFLVVIDHVRRLPAGVVRMILPSPAGLKSLNDLEPIWGVDADSVLARSDIVFNPEATWDVATIAVLPEYRSSSTNGLISLALIQAVSTLGASAGVELGVAVFDVVALELIQAVCARAWKPFKGLDPKGYLGSPLSIACYCDLQDYGKRLAFTNPDLYEMLWLGRGLEAGVSSPQWDVDSMRMRAVS
jgi:hypothetical protein